MNVSFFVQQVNINSSLTFKAQEKKLVSALTVNLLVSNANGVVTKITRTKTHLPNNLIVIIQNG
jgi:hypothetical protein